MSKTQSTTNMSKQDRLIVANQFIETISSCGRNFFEHKGFVSTLELDSKNKVWFIDYYTKKRINTHKESRWDGFTSGGTLKSFIEALRNFVIEGRKLNLNYFIEKPSNEYSLGGHPWAYGEDLDIVRNKGVELGIINQNL